MNAIDEIITNLDDTETVFMLVIEQGRTHVRFGEDLTQQSFWVSSGYSVKNVKR